MTTRIAYVVVNPFKQSHAFRSKRICKENPTDSLKRSQRPPPLSPEVITQTAAPVFYFDGGTVSVNDTKQYPVPVFVVEQSRAQVCL